MPEMRMNSLKSRAMNCGPLSEMIRGFLRMATFSSGVKCFRSFLIRSLRYLNGRALSPFPTEAGQHLEDILGKQSAEAPVLRRVLPNGWTTEYSEIETTTGKQRTFRF